VTATLSGNAYTSGTLITGNGTYVFVVTDVVGNFTGASFTIIPPVELNSGNVTQTPYNCATDATGCDLSSQGITSIAPDTFINHTNLTDLNL